MRVAVAGGTGVVGRHVVEVVSEAGHTPVILSRGRGVDLVSGAGLEHAIRGADVVIDVSNIVATGRRQSTRFFETATTNLLRAGRAAGLRHHVVLSIVGVDRVKFGYYEGKLRQEELALSGSVPATVLRATQFYEFPEQILERVPGPVAVVPRQLIRPVAAAEVASELVSLALGEPQGMAAELAGPEEHQLVDLARRISRERGRRRPVIGLRLPGEGGRAMASGGLLPGPGARVGQQGFEEWMAAVV